MKNYETWSVKIDGDIKWSEIVQRIALSFGYQWQNGNTGVYLGKIDALMFDPETRIMKLIFSGDGNYNIVLTTITEILKYFNNPPEKIVTELKLKNGEIFHKNGEVSFTKSACFNGQYFDELVEKRKKFLGIPTATPPATADVNELFPYIEFLYPTSDDGKLKTRHILATNSDLTYLRGYDIMAGYGFKVFKQNKITESIIFHGFGAKK